MRCYGSLQARPLRPAFLTPALSFGGADMCMLDMAATLPNARPAGLAVLQASHVDPDMLAKAKKLMPVWLGNSADLTAQAALHKACERANVLITWGCRELPQLTANLDLPIIQVSHCGPGSAWAVQTEQLIGDNAHYRVAVSQTAAKTFPPSPTAITVLPNGIDPNRVTPYSPRPVARANWCLTPRERVLLFVGRLHSDKRPELLLSAMRHLPAEWRLWLLGPAGNTDLLHQLELEARRDLGGRVAFLDKRLLVGDFYSAADVFCLPSPSEGLPLAHLEAMFAGIPAVLCDHDWSREAQLKHGEISWRVPVEVKPQELAEAIQEAAAAGRQDPRVLAAKTAAWEHYTLTGMAHRWAAYLTEVICDWTTISNHQSLAYVAPDSCSGS